MKTSIYIICSTLFLFFSVRMSPGQDITQEEILEKYFDEIGQDKIVQIQTAIATGVTIQNGQETYFKQIQKQPDKAYMEILLADGSIIKQGYDGSHGWMLAPGMNVAEPVILTGPDLKTIKEMGNMEGDLWNWKEKGHKLSYSGVKKFNGQQVHLLRLMKSDGDTDELYIGTEDFLLHKMNRITNINDSPVTVEVLFSDYRDTLGIKLPFNVEQKFNDMQGMTVTIKDIKFNLEIDDEIFERPR